MKVSLVEFILETFGKKLVLVSFFLNLRHVLLPRTGFSQELIFIYLFDAVINSKNVGKTTAKELSFKKY